MRSSHRTWRPPRRLATAALALATVSGSLLITYASGPAASAASCPWVGSTARPDQKADQVIAQMSLTDEVNLVTGLGWGRPYTGQIAANPALCIPAFNLMDGPAGIGHGEAGVTQLPAPVAGAASWNTSLEQQYGTVVGQEVAGKGGHVSLGPTVNIVRDPRWGRAFESFGEDPYLTGKMGVAEINGVQSQGVMAQIKHLAANNQETDRTSINAVVDKRTLQQTYLPAFHSAIDAGVASVMCSYNHLNGPWACDSPELLSSDLKGEFGFHGFVTSDWDATNSTVAAANAGLDMDMPGGKAFGSALLTAVNNNQVPRSRLDDMCHRILREMFAFGLFDKAPTGSLDANVTSPAHTAVAKQVAQEGTVLLKNAGGVLPVDTATVHSIAVIGQDASTATLSRGGGSAEVNPPYVVTPYQGIAKRAAASGINVQYAMGSSNDGTLPQVPASALKPDSGSGSGLTGRYYPNTSLSGTPALTRTDSNVDFMWYGQSPGSGLGKTDWSAKWTGTLTAPVSGTYTFSLTSDDGSRLLINNNQIIDNWRDQATTTRTGTVSLTAGQSVPVEVDYYQKAGDSNVSLGWQPPGPTPMQQAVTTAQNSDVAVVFAGYKESEGGDISGSLSDSDNQLISQVAAANPRTIVVLNTGSAVTMPWLGQVAGVFEGWYPGQEYGNVIASLLFGDANPSGKLPVTFPKSLKDIPDSTPAQWTGTNGQVQYSEGDQIGYRWYNAQNKAPLFPFGYGLSYTSFAFSNLQVTGPDSTGKVTATAAVKNTGSRSGSEVAQLYLDSPPTSGEQALRLRGFSKVTLQPGQSTTVTFTLTPADLAVWSTTSTNWTTPGGTYQVFVGDSASPADLPLHATFRVSGPDPTGETVAGVAANLCLDNHGASTSNGSPVQIYGCNGTVAQQVTANSDGTLRIQGKCVDVAGGARENGTQVQLYDCTSNNGAQQWVPQPNGALLNPQSNRCLDDPGATLTAGTQLQIYDCNNTAAQRWRIP